MNIELETVDCAICGDKTTMLGTQLCDGCWELRSAFNRLRSRNPKAAREWLDRKRAEQWDGDR